jgi:biotin transporter BioY
MRSIALTLTLLIPDRLPSLIVLVGFWIPPAVAGLLAAEFLRRSTKRYRAAATYAALATFVLGYSAAWFFLNVSAIPPYLPGATQDPTYAPPEAVAALAVLTCALILPGSAIACVLAFRIARRLRESIRRVAAGSI